MACMVLVGHATPRIRSTLVQRFKFVSNVINIINNSGNDNLNTEMTIVFSYTTSRHYDHQGSSSASLSLSLSLILFGATIIIISNNTINHRYNQASTSLSTSLYCDEVAVAFVQGCEEERRRHNACNVIIGYNYYYHNSN